MSDGASQYVIVLCEIALLIGFMTLFYVGKIVQLTALRTVCNQVVL